MTAVLAGFVLGLSLIAVIGAQNAFVLRQGIKGEHVLAVALTCAVSDMVLIAVGVAGAGSGAIATPGVLWAFKWGGAAFVFVYGARRLHAGWRVGGALHPGTQAADLRTTLATCLALTWLNPHVYLDTVILLGALSTQYPTPWMFGVGAACASIAFFMSLAYGARRIAPFLGSPRAWRVFEIAVGVTMWAMAVGLIWT